MTFDKRKLQLGISSGVSACASASQPELIITKTDLCRTIESCSFELCETGGIKLAEIASCPETSLIFGKRYDLINQLRCQRNFHPLTSHGFKFARPFVTGKSIGSARTFCP